MLYFGLVIFAIYIVFKFLYIAMPLMKRNRLDVQNECEQYKSFSILVPAYNEKDVILNCVKSLTNISYPNFSVFIINDGSNDEMFDVLNSFLHLYPVNMKECTELHFERITSKCRSKRYPNIFVINKKNGGKADALNAGIACCRAQYIVSLDADCMLKSDAIAIMNNVFQDEKVIAAGGTVHIIQSIRENGKQTRLACALKNIIKFQTMQYMTAFYLHKYTQSILGALIVISGAYGAFKRSVLIEVGGYRKSVGEDMDVTLKIHRYIKQSKDLYAMTYVPSSVCYTECPENMRNLTKQRIRWQKAFVDCVVKYGLKMFRKFKSAISLFFVVDSLILGTVTAFMVFLVPLFAILNREVSTLFIAFFSIDFLIGIIENVITIVMSARYGYRFERKDLRRILAFIPLQLLSYRFLNIVFVLIGTASYLKNKDHWNKAERLGRTIAQPMRWEQKNMFAADISGIYPNRMGPKQKIMRYPAAH